MATLILRSVDDSMVRALKVRADRNGLSPEAEHLKILKRALLHPTKNSFIDALWSIPNVGIDSDFERV